MSVRRTLFPTLALAALAALVLASSAGAAFTTHKTTVTFNFATFKGKVKSAGKFCTQERKVRLYRERTNRVLVGTTTSAADGSWSIPRDESKLTVGSYYVTVSAKSSAETGVHCLAAKSDVAVAD
jgi:hypothetical protein